jgi:UDP-glucose 4-epimerase
MKYLVTGGAGFIGSYITKHLVNHGDSVVVLDNLYTGKKKNLADIENKIEFIDGDIRDFKLLESIMKNTKGVFHQAALASVPESYTIPEKYDDVNVNGTENIFKLAKQFGLKVVYASSSSVYGNPKNIPMKESDESKPINPYAKTKADKEKLAIKYSGMGVDIIGLRYFNVYGIGQSKEYAGVIKLFLEQIRDKLPPNVNGDGTQFRDFVHVSDVVKANILSMDSNVPNGFFNVGTNSSITVLDLAKLVIEHAGLDIKPVFRPALKGDVHKSLCNNQLIREKIGWTPTIKLEDWLKEIITLNKIDEV